MSILNGSTMFADYRVAQVWLHKGVLIYSKQLRETLDRKEELPFGDERECKIRK